MVESNLHKFQKGIELASQNSELLRKRQIKLNSDISEIKAQVKTPYPNFEFLLTNIYSDKNLTLIQKKIKEDVALHDRNIEKYFIKELNKLELKVDTQKILEQIQDVVYLKANPKPPTPPRR